MSENDTEIIKTEEGKVVLPKYYKEDYIEQWLAEEVAWKSPDLKLDTMNFIWDFEWFRECAYKDNNIYSIWFWTISFPWECITREEAIQRKIEHINPLLEIVDKSCYSDNQRIALVSYMYNVGRHPMNLQTHIKNCNHKEILYVMSKWGWSAGWVRLWGLVKRRNIEIAKYNTN